MCINCGFIAPAPSHPPNVGCLCSQECQDQWEALCSQIEDDDEADKALYELGKFAIKWPNATLDEFKHLVATSQRMAAKYPTVWPFWIEYHEDNGCWHYARKSAALTCH
jgi:hypothetical protein